MDRAIPAFSRLRASQPSSLSPNSPGHAGPIEMRRPRIALVTISTLRLVRRTLNHHAKRSHMKAYHKNPEALSRAHPGSVSGDTTGQDRGALRK